MSKYQEAGRCGECLAFLPSVKPDETPPEFCSYECRTIAKLREALLALVACPDYRNIHTHEMSRARKVLEETQP